VKKWQEEDGENDGATQIDESPPEDPSKKHAMDVDADESFAPAHGEDTGGDSDSDDEEDPSDVAMVPMADILNARYGCENVCSISVLFSYHFVFNALTQAKLFYEPDVLRMVSTKDIKASEQIVCHSSKFAAQDSRLR
jgi:N-lysine methyltransferase SETD6